ncbi:MAG: universal stress protein [Euryarchaeota archaeon]|nr:universal stress protein [Euryarchaeota archaeon]
MKVYKNILVPTDGSEYSELAIPHAITIAKSTGAKITTLYVVDTSAFAGIPAGGVWENMRKLLQEEGKRAVARAKEITEKEGIEASTTIEEGSPADKIVEVAKNEDADIIIMGTAGKTGFNRFLLGSVAEKVVRGAPCPVMVVRRKT